MKKLVVLTGAGISAESGIKTFRDADGLWEGYDVMEVASPKGFRENAELVLDFYNQRRKQLLAVKPNKAHYNLAVLEKHFDVEIITQNIDDLHERAGCKNITHLHGELLKVRSVIDENLILDWKKDLILGDVCSKGHQLRPHIVWFGEMVPMLDKAIEIDTNIDIGHGRIETRKCSVISNFLFVENKNQKWKNLNQVIKIESIREFKNSDKPTEKATRYYISSLENDANQYQKNIRSHWGIENKLHWTLDVGFSEDSSRKRNKNAAQNYSVLLKIALNLLKNEKTEKQGIAGKRLKAGWNENYLLKVLSLKV